jgi:preprotein translocase subunit YajC
MGAAYSRWFKMKKNISTLTAISSLLLSTHAFADGAAPAKEGGLPQTLVILGMALVFFYFILWRPEQKRRKKMETQRSSMKIGDKVTAMGIIGTLAQIKETSIVLKMFDGSKIEMLKNCITDVQSSSADVTVEDAK